MGYFSDGLTIVPASTPDRVMITSGCYTYTIPVSDQDAFIAHMDAWYSITGKPYTREEYEALCLKFGCDVLPDDAIGGYGDQFGDFGMDHYHTIPQNRLHGMSATLAQGRWCKMLQEHPHIEEERRCAAMKQREVARIEALRKSYPEDLDAWIEAVGGLEAIYEEAQSIHSNNPSQLRDEGRHFEWLIGHACLHLGMHASKSHPDYVPPNGMTSGIYPLCPQWWGDWRETDTLHPIQRIATMLADRRIEPYIGKVTYIGYGEDCGDDVRQNAQEWLGI